MIVSTGGLQHNILMVKTVKLLGLFIMGTYTTNDNTLRGEGLAMTHYGEILMIGLNCMHSI